MKTGALILATAVAASSLIGCSGETAPSIIPGQTAALDDVTLHLNLGDSVGAGYNATALNDEAGRAYARLLYENHPAYPDRAADCVVAFYPDAVFVDRAKSGGTSTDVVYQVFALPDAGAGDVLVTIYVGGNDFNDDVNTMLLPKQNQVAIDAWVTNMTTAVAELRNTYHRPEQGRTLVISMATIHEPTDQMLSLPPEYEDGFCATLQQMTNLSQTTIDTIYDNYQAFNRAIREFAAQHDIVLIDAEHLFVGHGLNAPQSERWIDTDCTHLTNEGHHQLRLAAWSLLGLGDR